MLPLNSHRRYLRFTCCCNLLGNALRQCTRAFDNKGQWYYVIPFLSTPSPLRAELFAFLPLLRVARGNAILIYALANGEILDATVTLPLFLLALPYPLFCMYRFTTFILQGLKYIHVDMLSRRLRDGHVLVATSKFFPTMKSYLKSTCFYN